MAKTKANSTFMIIFLPLIRMATVLLIALQLINFKTKKRTIFRKNLVEKIDKPTQTIYPNHTMSKYSILTKIVLIDILGNEFKANEGETISCDYMKRKFFWHGSHPSEKVELREDNIHNYTTRGYIRFESYSS
jgi:hypothetical protein